MTGVKILRNSLSFLTFFLFFTVSFLLFLFSSCLSLFPAFNLFTTSFSPRLPFLSSFILSLPSFLSLSKPYLPFRSLSFLLLFTASLPSHLPIPSFFLSSIPILPFPSFPPFPHNTHIIQNPSGVMPPHG